MRRIIPLAAILVAAATPGAQAQSRFDGSGRTATLACAGDDAIVRGSGNRLTLSGQCRSLALTGSDNVVAIDLAARGGIRVTGDNNRILYDPARGGPPEAITRGAYNEVLPGPGGVAALAPATQAAPPVLVVDSTDPAGAIACAGRDVVIRGSYRAYELRGGCRSVTVEGTSNTVTAELLPGAPVTIAASAVIVNYALVSDGPPPFVRVANSGLTATHLARFGETELSIPTGQ